MSTIFINPYHFGGGWWNGAIIAYQPKGAASLAASYVNLAKPGTNNAAPGVAPTWDGSNGWIFNGSTQYLLTGAIPTATSTMIVRFSDGATDIQREVCGSQNPVFVNTRFRICNHLTGQRGYFYGSSAANRITPGVTNGVMAMAGGAGYYNGIAEGTQAGIFSGTGIQVAIGAYWSAITASAFFAGNVQAFALYDNTLDAAQVAAVSAEMAAL